MSYLLEVPEGGKRIEPEKWFRDAVPEALGVEAILMPDGRMIYVNVMPVLHVDVELTKKDAGRVAAIVEPMLRNLAGYAQFKTGLPRQHSAA